MSEESQSNPKLTRNFIISASVVLVLILFFIIFGIRGSPEEYKPNIIEYNFFEFEEIQGFWETDIQLDDKLYRASFRFNPEDVQHVEINGAFGGFKTQPIYLTFDPEAESEEFKYLALGTTELSLHLIRALNYSVEAACTKNVTAACMDRPIVNCQDENKSVIYLVPKPPAQITLEDNCITVSGAEFDLVKSIDRLLFQWYKIMQ